jgi:hypothetical protein
LFPAEPGTTTFCTNWKFWRDLLFVPRRTARRERHEVQGRVVDRMANNASGVSGTLGKEDGLDLGLEELVVQRGGRSRLGRNAPRRPNRRQCSGKRRLFALQDHGPIKSPAHTVRATTATHNPNGAGPKRSITKAIALSAD